MLTRHSVVGMSTLGMIVFGAGVVWGQDYPNRHIRIVTGGAGGGNDFAARLISPALSARLGQPVIVENRGGSVASGEAVSKSPPDGYALLLTGSFWIAPLLRPTPYDPVNSFSPITLATKAPEILVVHPSIPAKSVKELIALAKAKPGELNYSYAAVGGTGHLAGELFKAMAGVKIVGAAYKSDTQEITDLLGGYVQLSFQGGAKVGTYIKAGKLRALAVASGEPYALTPGLPTVAATVPGYASVTFQGFHAPAKTPQAIITRLNQEIVRVLNQADVKQKFFDFGVEVVGNSPEEAAATIKADIALWGKVIKDAGIKAD